MQDVIRLRITESSEVGEARRRAASLAQAIGLNESEAGKLAIIVTEVASNLVKHTLGKGGEIVLQKVKTPKSDGVEVLALDHGPGMRLTQECIRDGYSTAGTQGIGLGGIQRLSSEFDLYSAEGKGTALMARVLREVYEDTAKLASPWEIGALCLPVAGETVCGDAWAYEGDEQYLSLLVADGLGHGPLAHEASEEAVRVFHENPKEEPTRLLNLSNGALKKTRGAAVSILKIDLRSMKGGYTGVGNIAGVLCSDEKSHSMVSMNGIVGHECRRIQEFQYTFSRNGLVILHSDGLNTRWDLSAYPGLMRRHPSLIAGVLYRDFSRGRDDVTVIVARLGKGRSGVVAA